jgi:tRNA nucleotidyltransferase/poly(A) polymerase
MKHDINIYIVGGYIRDSLSNIKSKDIDIIIDKELSLIIKILGKGHIIGQRCPIVKIPHLNMDISSLINSNTGSIYEDSLKRDFNVNAIYYLVNQKKFIDPHNGIQGIVNKKIEYVCKKSFYEENIIPLRMYRLIGQGYISPLEYHEIAFINLSNRKINYNAVVFKELKKIFTSNYVFETIEILYKYKILEIIFPELHLLIFNGFNLKIHFNNCIPIELDFFQIIAKIFFTDNYFCEIHDLKLLIFLSKFSICQLNKNSIDKLLNAINKLHYKEVIEYVEHK